MHIACHRSFLCVLCCVMEVIVNDSRERALIHCLIVFLVSGANKIVEMFISLVSYFLLIRDSNKLNLS